MNMLIVLRGYNALMSGESVKNVSTVNAQIKLGVMNSGPGEGFANMVTTAVLHKIICKGKMCIDPDYEQPAHCIEY